MGQWWTVDTEVAARLGNWVWKQRKVSGEGSVLGRVGPRAGHSLTSPGVQQGAPVPWRWSKGGCRSQPQPELRLEVQLWESSGEVLGMTVDKEKFSTRV